MGKAGKAGKRSKAGSRGKRTRFHLTRKGETALAWTGGLVVLVLVVILLFWAKGRLLPADPAEAKRLAEVAHKDTVLYDALVAEGAIVKAAEGREDLVVDRQKWLAKTLTEREHAGGAAARKLGLRRAFFDDSAGVRVGWYLAGSGYKEPPKAKP